MVERERRSDARTIKEREREREGGGGRGEKWREKMLTILYLIQFYNIIITT